MPYRLFYRRVIRVYCGSLGETRLAPDPIAVRAFLFLRSSALSRRRALSVLYQYGELLVAATAYYDEHAVFQYLDSLLNQALVESLGGRKPARVAAERIGLIGVFIPFAIGGWCVCVATADRLT
jgi:hypothetical protein